MAAARPTRRGWAVALAAWIGAIAGSVVAPSMDSLGFSLEGSHPLLGGSAAIYVAFALGPTLGACVGAGIAYVTAGRDHARRGALLGSVAGIVAAAVVGYFSEPIAEAWANAFRGAPFSAAFVAAVVAGAGGGVAAALLVRTMRPEGPRVARERRFSALLGSLVGLLAGLGGAALGAYLVLGDCATPGGTANLPSVSACDFTQGALGLGAWAGAAVGAAAGLLTAAILARGATAPVAAS